MNFDSYAPKEQLGDGFAAVPVLLYAALFSACSAA